MDAKKIGLIVFILLILFVVSGCNSEFNDNIRDKLDTPIKAIPSTEISSEPIPPFMSCSNDEDCDSTNVKTICLKCPGAKILVFRNPLTIVAGTLDEGICKPEYQLGDMSQQTCIINWGGEEFVSNDGVNGPGYLQLWKQKRLSKLSEQYINDHFLVFYAGNQVWASGLSPYFEVNYYYFYDWAVIRRTDEFRVRDDTGVQLNEQEILNSMTLPKIEQLSTLMGKREVLSILHEKCSDALNFDVRIPGYNQDSGVTLSDGGKLTVMAYGEGKSAVIDLETGEILACN